jgi:DNA-binding transcriptional ArsR family regulator
MDDGLVVSALAALGQSTRLAAYRLLLESEPDGLSAGDIATRVGTPQNTMSNHLAVLANAGLVTSRRQSQHIIYRANVAAFTRLITFLVTAKDTSGAPTGV